MGFWTIQGLPATSGQSTKKAASWSRSMLVYWLKQLICLFWSSENTLSLEAVGSDSEPLTSSCRPHWCTVGSSLERFICSETGHAKGDYKASYPHPELHLYKSQKPEEPSHPGWLLQTTVCSWAHLHSRRITSQANGLCVHSSIHSATDPGSLQETCNAFFPQGLENCIKMFNLKAQLKDCMLMSLQTVSCMPKYISFGKKLPQVNAPIQC